MEQWMGWKGWNPEARELPLSPLPESNYYCMIHAGVLYDTCWCLIYQKRIRTFPAPRIFPTDILPPLIIYAERRQ